MKATFTIILMLTMFFVKAPITAQTNSRVTEIFNYNDPATTSVSYTLATAQNSNTVAVHAGTSPILIQNVDNDSKFYCSETYEHDKQEKNWWQRMQFYAFFDNDTKFFGKFHDLNDETEDSAFIYDLETKSLIKYYSEDRFIHGISYDGSVFFTQDLNNNTLRLQSTATQTVLTSLQIENKVSNICYPKESNIWCILFYSSNATPLVIFYEKNTNKELFRYSPPLTSAIDIRLSHNGLYCAISGYTSNSTELIIYSTVNRNIVRKHSDPSDAFGFASCADFSGNDEFYCFGIGHVLNVVKTATGEIVFSSEIKHLEFGSILGLRWLPDNKRVAVQGKVNRGFYTSLVNTSTDDYIMLALPAIKYLHVFDGGNKVLFIGEETICFDRTTGKILWNFSGFIPPRGFDIDEKNNRMAFTIDKRTIWIVRMPDGLVEEKIATDASNIFCVRFSQSKRYITYLSVKKNTVYIYDRELKMKREIVVPITSIEEPEYNEPTDVFWDDVQTNRILVQYSRNLIILDVKENPVIALPEDIFSRSLSDPLFKPEHSTLGKYKGKVFSDNKPLYLFEKDELLLLYDYKTKYLLLDDNKKAVSFRHDFSEDELFYTFDEMEQKIIIITSDTLLYQWDIASNKEVMKMKLPMHNVEYGYPAVGYSLAHKDGISTVATLTDNRRVVFMEIPDAPVSVHEENIAQKSEITSYPQPIIAGDGHCTLNLPTADVESIIAITVLGEIIPLEFSKTSTNTYRFSVENLSPGQYSLQIITETQQKLYHTIIVL